jgi:membrane fusion protein, multidrug efflux system
VVEVAIPDAAAQGVRPGYLARAELLVDRRERALAVPAGAVAELGNGHYVMVIGGDERLERRPVTPGITRGGWQEILEGLAPGDRVVATNPLDLSEGTRVRIVGWAG